MADVFLQLSAEDRRDALSVVADRSGRPTHLLEKDVWVVWALATLYAAPLGEHLVFKGGTSLSKAYQVIRRFSEDVDLTYDIRAIAPDLVGDNGEGLPKTRSEEKRWSSEVRRRLPAWVAETVQPVIETALAVEGLAAAVRVEDEKLFIDYEATAAGSGYVAPSVMLEFGARSTGEPASLRDVVCDAAGLIEGCSSRRRGRASCTRSGRSGRRRPPSTSSASRSGCAATASRDIGTMLSDWTKPALRKPLLPIATWPTLSPGTSRCSSQRRLPTARRSTMQRLSAAACNSCRSAMARRRWRMTMPAWLRMDCSSTTRSRSKRSWRSALI